MGGSISRPKEEANKPAPLTAEERQRVRKKAGDVTLKHAASAGGLGGAGVMGLWLAAKKEATADVLAARTHELKT